MLAVILCLLCIFWLNMNIKYICMRMFCVVAFPDTWVDGRGCYNRLLRKQSIFELMQLLVRGSHHYLRGISRERRDLHVWVPVNSIHHVEMEATPRETARNARQRFPC